ncbi:MAG: hypothetical protein ACT4OY_08455, partial [Alphaproteobacteria bacterium]
LFNPTGKYAAAGLSGIPVKLNRNIMNQGLGYVLHVFIHEVAHNETGAADADKAFRDFLSYASGQIALMALGMKPIPGHELEQPATNFSSFAIA